MKRRRSTGMIALLLAAVMTFTGCGNAGEATSTESASGTQASESTGSAETSGDLYLSDEKLDITIWFPMTSAAAAYTDTIDGNVSYGKVEELFNVDLHFIEEPEADAQQKFQLLIAGDDLPDLMSYTNYYPAGGEALIDEGVALDLAPYLDQLPNYKARIEADPSIARDVYTDTGKIYEFFTIQNYTQPAYCGILIRGDWLEQVGMEEPTTVDELHDVLVAFKEQCTGGVAPMQLYQDGFGIEGSLIGMFGVMGGQAQYNWWTLEDGEVQFSPYLDGFQRYVQTMSDWYAEGLIDPNYTSNTEMFGNNELIATTGVFNGMFTQAGEYYSNAGYIEEGGYFICANMITEDGSPRRVGQYRPSAVLKQGVLVNPESEHLEEILKMVDYFYSDEGSILATYGVEGETWHYDDEGNIVADDIIVKNENMNISGARHANVMKNFGMYNIRNIEDDYLDEYQSAYLTKWVNEGFDKVVPMDYLSLTAEEGGTYNSIMSDVNTYILENVNRFITGVESMDNWDAFIEGFASLDVEGARTIVSDAYTRYMNRPVGEVENGGESNE